MFQVGLQLKNVSQSCPHTEAAPYVHILLLKEVKTPRKPPTLSLPLSFHTSPPPPAAAGSPPPPSSSSRKEVKNLQHPEINPFPPYPTRCIGQSAPPPPPHCWGKALLHSLSFVFSANPESEVINILHVNICNTVEYK